MNERKPGEGDEESEGVKASVFAVVLLALRDSELSFGRYAFLLVLEFLQVLQFAFSRNVTSTPANPLDANALEIRRSLPLHI